MQGYLALRVLAGDEDGFGGFHGVVGVEAQAQTVGFGGWVERVVGDGEVELPFLEVVGGDEGEARGEGTVDLVGGVLVVEWVYRGGEIWKLAFWSSFWRRFVAIICSVLSCVDDLRN
jgi:hypothetical protein